VVFSPTDTIAAIATAPVRAGIGVVRISGPRAHDVARAMLAVPHDLAPRHATLTHVLGGPERGALAACSGQPRARRGVEGPNQEGRIPKPEAGIPSIDEVIATYFPAPHSYTAEDVVEISAHGSPALLRDIVRAAIAAGARLAEPGEFTLRAFLNGRIDLVQAEAVADLVDAVTPLQARVAFDQLEGTLTRAIGSLDQALFDLAARLEASVDFPDEGYHFVAPGEAAEALGRVRDSIDALLATSATGRVIREGRHIAILGKPNVGKSSLFNRLVGVDRAIVAAGPGTTRDMLHESIDLDGIRLGLVDTAGIRVSDDEAEQEGVVRARRAASVADLVILVLDRSRPLEDVDRALLRETAASPRIVVINKIDLPAAWSTVSASGVGETCREPLGAPDKCASRVPSAARGAPLRGSEKDTAPSPHEVLGPSGAFVGQSSSACSHGSPQASPPPGVVADKGAGTPQPPLASTDGVLTKPESGTPSPERGPIQLSLKSGDGLEALRAAMRDALEVAEPLRDAPMVTNVRHESLLRQAREAVVRALENIEEAGESASEELVLADIADARRAFEEVTGKRTTEDVLRLIFERFCIGK
jgi:tRNA modification GTPase